MKLSTRGRYGIQAMYDLACFGRDAPQSIKAVAERSGVPEAYLEQLVGGLRRAGLVKSVRGATGGYMLAREPGEISVGEVLRASEGDLSLTECLSGKDPCQRAGMCPSRLVWLKLSEGLNRIADGITLQDMLDDGERMRKEGNEVT